MDLAQLITATKGDRSYESLARAGGGVPGAKRWHQLATLPIRNFPDPPTVRALSRALGVTETTVVLAAARSLGLEVSGSDNDLATLLPSRAGQLTAKQVAAVRQVVMAMAEPEDDTGATVTRLPSRRRESTPEERAAYEGMSEGRALRNRLDAADEVSQDPDDQQ